MIGQNLGTSHAEKKGHKPKESLKIRYHRIEKDLFHKYLHRNIIDLQFCETGPTGMEQKCESV